MAETAEAPRGTSSASWAIYVLVLVLLIAAVVVPTAIHLVNEKNDDDAVEYTPLYDTSGLPLYDERILEGYASTDDFQRDMTLASQQFVNNVAGRVSGDDERYAGIGWGWRGSRGDGIALGGIEMADGAVSEDVPVSAPTSRNQNKQSAPHPVDDSVNDLGTNNQEEGVEEGDIIVASASAGKLFVFLWRYCVA